MGQKVLVVAAHPDDELLGLGGTLARHAARGDEVTIALVADGGQARAYSEKKILAVRACAQEAARRLGASAVRFGGYVDQRLDTEPILEITKWVEEVMSEVRPAVVYTHHRGDINHDHQVVHDATLTAVRPIGAAYVERVLCYETPSATEWGGPYGEQVFVPNVFVDIADFLEKKLEATAAYQTELREFPHPRSLVGLRMRAAYWGSVIGARAAEPFMLVREIQR